MDAPEPAVGWSLPRWVLVVVSLVAAGLVLTDVLGNPPPYLAKANETRAKSDIAAICTAIETYRIEHERLPEDLEALVAPDENGHTYLKDLTDVPLDPWKHPYVYEPHPDGTYRVISYGEDGRPGGEGLSADIDNVGIREGR
jgi:general secretion pathway protein G